MVGGPSIFLKPNTKGKEFSVEEMYSYYGIRAHIQARQYHYEKGKGRRSFVVITQFGRSAVSAKVCYRADAR